MQKMVKKIAKITGWLILSVVILFLAAFLFAWFKAPSYIKENLSGVVAEKSNGLYHLDYSDIELKLIPLSLKIKDFNLDPDNVVARLRMQEEPGKIIFAFESSSIEFQNIKIKKLWLEKSFHAEKLLILDPLLELTGNEILKKDSSQTAQDFFTEFHPLFKSYLKEIIIDKIEFSDAQYYLSQAIADTTQISKAERISIDIIHFRTDSALIFNSAQNFTTDDILIRMNDFQNDLGDSLHVVQIDTLKYSLKTSDIQATGFHLSALDQNRNKNSYDVYVPRFYMKSKSITNLTLKDSIHVEFLEFIEPEIKFFQKENPKKIGIEDLNKFNLYTLIQNDFSKIEIDTFYLTQANMEIYRQPDTVEYQHRFNSVNINLTGFDLDSLSALNRQKLLHADDLEMTVSDYHLRLEDNQHDFRADSLFVSTYNRSLGATNVAISPAEKEDFESRMEVNIKGDALELSDVNLKDLYHTRILPTSGIEITKPEVHLTYHTEIKKTKKQEEAGLLFDLVSAYLRGVYSNLVYIENGILNIQNFYNNNLQGYFETQFSFSLTDFSLDSASVNRTDKFFYATNFELRFSDYEMKLVDDLHKLDVDNIFISSLNQSVKINNLHLQPVVQNVSASTMKRYNRSELYNIFVPEINLREVNLRNAFFYNRLKIDNFSISNPNIYFENFGTLRKSKEKVEFSELYQLVSSYIHDFDIEEITIPNGEIIWVNHTRKGKTTSFDNEFSATFENFRLNEDELNKKRLLFSDNFDISVKDQIFQLSDSVHILSAGEVNLSTATSSVMIKDALLYPVITADNYSELSTTFQVSIPELKISNFDFLTAYYSRQLELNILDINNPKFQIYNQPGSFKSLELKKYSFPLPAFIKSLQLNEFNINDGEVLTFETQGINHKALSTFKFNLSVPGLSLKNKTGQETMLETNNLILDILAFKSPLGKDHDISIDNINFNRQQQHIKLNNVEINPFLPQGKGNQFAIAIPEISLSGFDINKAMEDNTFGFDAINILEPQIKIEINDSVKGDKIEFLQTLDLYPYTESFVDKIQVNNLNLTRTEINFNWFRKQLIDQELNLKFKNILVAENQPPANLLNSEEFEISTTNLRETDKKGIYEFTVDSFFYNSASHSILFKNIIVNPLLEKENIPKITGFQTDVVNAQIDFVELKGIEEKTWLNDNILDAKLLKIGESKIDIFRNKRFPFNHNQRPPWPQELIKNLKQPFVFDSISLAPSDLRYNELLLISDKPGFILFNNLQFNTGKLSNIPEITRQYQNLKVDASAILQNQAKLEVTINFDLTAADYHHEVSGSLGELPLTSFNTIIEKSAPVTVVSGNLNRFDFNMKLDDKYAVGELYFGYNNFKISMLDYSKDGVRKSKFATFWANKMILNSEYPKKEEFLPANIYYERDPERSVINYWWKSIYSGAKKTLGLETKE